MAARQNVSREKSTSEVTPISIFSHGRLSFESQVSTDLSILDFPYRDDPLPLDSEASTDGAHKLDKSSTPPGSVLTDEVPQETHLRALQGWPTSPRSIEISTSLLIWYIVVDISLLAISFTFFVFAILVLSFDQKPTSSHQRAARRFEQASNWVSQKLPDLAIKLLTGFRARRSIPYSLLRLLGEPPMLFCFGDLRKANFHLRTVSYVGLGLVAIWMLSPVGGQSSFRQITFGPKQHSESTTYTYVVPGPGMWAPDQFTTESILNSFYVAALLSPATKEASPRDAWGHAKIPRIEHYESTSSPDKEGWYSTDNGTGDSYSSFIGVPMSGIDSPDYADYAAKIEAMYFRPICSSASFPDDGFDHSSWIGNLHWTENTVERSRRSAEDLTPFSSVWKTRAEPQSNYKPFLCTLETAYVEVEVLCATHTTCSASHVRRSLLEHPSVAYTQLGLIYRENETMWEKAIESSSGLLSEGYVQDPRDPRNQLRTTLDDLPTETVGVRIGQMLNAYWATMNGKSVFTGAFNEHTTWLDQSIAWKYQDGSQLISSTGPNIYTCPIGRTSNCTLQSPGAGQISTWNYDHYSQARTWATTGTKRSNVEVFHAHYQWVVALIISSTILIMASVVPLYVRTRLSCGPDILMNFSSLATRDNPYVALPATGTHLDAADRSRFMRHVRIRFGDVEGENAIGRLGIGRLNGDVAPLRKGRQYA
ncbi:hypothetical protein J4E83_009850 [Alternaria metachromatica]|uniref:uncharacterized protein n=1 Tax=Alternaria metachromatica TaxID=283354 RepID=UPI0020C1C5B8|nr:uncharacterized protein J4E83_009850 [Alternaria metachromatica]KAI4606939.1 hypothetical protein J4E83_009850 [Alternaria metachromatica]